MAKNERNIEALSPECEAILAQSGMHSMADHKDETDPADIYFSDGKLVLSQVPRDIPPYYLTRLVEAVQLATSQNLHQVNTREQIDSEIMAFRKRLKAIREHYGAPDGARAWVELEDKARRAYIRLGKARDALEELSDEVSWLEKRIRQMVDIEREHNIERGRSGQSEVSVCHDFLQALSTSALKKLS